MTTIYSEKRFPLPLAGKFIARTDSTVKQKFEKILLRLSLLGHGLLNFLKRNVSFYQTAKPTSPPSSSTLLHGTIHKTKKGEPFGSPKGSKML